MAPAPQLWVPALVLAHAFVAFWIIKAAWLTRSSRLRSKGTSCHSEELSGRTVPSGPNAGPANQGCKDDVGGPGHCPDQQMEKGLKGPVLTIVAAAAGSQAGAAHEAEQAPSSEASNSTNSSCDGFIVPALDCGGLHMEWQGVGCSYNTNGTTKVVLADVWGKAFPGQMQALMGPSGAGKSTLMDILAMRKSVGTLSGRLLINGQPATSSFIQHTSYVPQEDTFIPTMTCRETLSFYAAVTLPDAWGGKASRRQRVAEVLNAVGLGQAGQTLVGGTLPGGLNLRGLSGGERRRLSIAAGILAAPSVLFMDEPTSGLDSFAALSVMGHLEHVAQATHQTVICTIHQPRSAIWEMFDRVTLLSSGRLMFHGPCQEMVPWFESLGYMYAKGSESDWVLDLVATGFDKPAHLYGHTLRTGSEIREVAAAFKEQYLRTEDLVDISVRQAPHRKQLPGASSDNFMIRPSSTQSSLSTLADRFSSMVAGASLPELSPEGGLSSSYPSGWWRQFSSLVGREIASSTRNPFDVASRVMTFTYVGLLFGLVFYDLPSEGLNAVRSRMNLLFGGLLAVTLLPYVGISLYTSDKKIYLADTSAKRYRPSAYYAAKVVATTPFHIFSSLCCCALLHGMPGLSYGDGRFVKLSCIITLMFLCANQVLHLSSVVMPNQDAMFAVSILWTAIQVLFSSYFISFSQVKLHWLSFLRYLAASYFGMEALIQTEFEGTTSDCSGGLDANITALLKGGMPSLTAAQRLVLDQMAKPQPGCVFDNNTFITYFEYGRSFAESAGILLGYLGLLHIMTFVSLMVAARRENR